jgi:hypothetical protein
MRAMRWVSILLLACPAVGAFAACGDVPHPPARILPKLFEAGVTDASADDGDAPDASPPSVDGPVRPLPISAECLGCGADPCFNEGVTCVGEPMCSMCLSDVLAPGCLQNQLLVDLGRCACTSHCYSICREVCDATRSTWERPPSDSGARD